MEYSETKEKTEHSGGLFVPRASGLRGFTRLVNGSPDSLELANQGGGSRQGETSLAKDNLTSPFGPIVLTREFSPSHIHYYTPPSKLIKTHLKLEHREKKKDSTTINFRKVKLFRFQLICEEFVARIVALFLGRARKSRESSREYRETSTRTSSKFITTSATQSKQVT